MSPEFLEKWEHILEDVSKNKIPVQFIKKIIVRLSGKRQQTINISKFIKQGLDSDQIEDIVGRNLTELEENITSVAFILDLEYIANTVQPETDKLLENLK